MLPVHLKDILCDMKELDLPKHETTLWDGQGTGQCVTSPLRGVEQSCLRAADWQTQPAQQAAWMNQFLRPRPLTGKRKKNKELKENLSGLKRNMILQEFVT